MPPRCCARCSMARRRRRGPLGPTDQPVGALRESVVGQRVAEQLVVDAEVVDVDARLRHAGAAAGLERVDRPVLRRPFGTQRRTGAAAQPLVLERAELVEVVVAPGSPCADPSRPCSAQSSQNGAAGRRVEVPVHQLADPRVEPGAGVRDGGRRDVERSSCHQVLGASSEPPQRMLRGGCRICVGIMVCGARTGQKTRGSACLTPRRARPLPDGPCSPRPLPPIPWGEAWRLASATRITRCSTRTSPT